MGLGKEEKGKKVILIMTDVAQAFPNIAKERLANRVRGVGVEEQLARWTTSFMSNCTVKLRFDGEEGKWHLVETGIPQGSPISPVLFNMYIAPLLRELEEKSETKWWGEDVITPTFIDDVTLAIARDTWEGTEERGERVMGWAEEWGDKSGVVFKKEKME